MARFILDVATQYDDKGKMTTDIQDLCYTVSGAIEETGHGIVSITPIERDNIGQFHNRLQFNKLTRKQVRVFNENPHG